MRHLKISLLAMLLILCSFLTARIDYYPRTIVSEYIPSTTEEINNRAYEGISRLTLRYNVKVLLPIRYYHSEVNPEYASASVDQYLDSIAHLQYGSLYMNKRWAITDTSLPIETGKPYHYLFQKEYFRTSPIKMDVTSFNNVTGDVEVAVTLLSATETFTNATIRFILVEDEIAPDVTNLAREIKHNTFDLLEQNGTINLNNAFTIDEGWNNNNLRVVAYVLYGDEIIQSASTYQTLQPYLRAAFPESRIDIGPASGLFEAPYFGLFFFGGSSSFTINTVLDQGPDNWFLAFCDDDGNCYFDPFVFELNDGESAGFHSNIVPEGAGMMNYSFVVTSPLFFEPFIIPATFITNNVDILVVDGDGWEEYENYITDLLDDSDYTYGVWSTSIADVSNEIDFNDIIWLTGEREPALTHNEMNFLKNHLAQSNNLFISGQNIGKHIFEHPLYQDRDFYNGYLNASLITPNSEQFQLYGVVGDPISEGINITLNNGDSASNQVSPSAIGIHYQHRGDGIFHYPDNQAGAIRTLNRQLSGSVVYLAFGFEGINTASDRQNVLFNSLKWFPSTDVEKGDKPSLNNNMILKPSYPNPFTGKASPGYRSSGIIIQYSIPNHIREKTTLSIYNIKGQLINRFSDLPIYEDDAGIVSWDGNDLNDNQTANGIYFYVLTDGINQQVRKLSIIR